MNVVEAIGATCLGIVIGWLLRYFIRRFEKFNAAVFGSIVSIIAGGVVVAFLGADQEARWFYPIGLLVGCVVYSLLGWLAGGRPDVVLYGKEEAGKEQPDRSKDNLR